MTQTHQINLSQYFVKKNGNTANKNVVTNNNGTIDLEDKLAAGSSAPPADTTNGSAGGNNTTTYAKSDHSHPKSTLYAESNHTHDTSALTNNNNTFASGNHTHDTSELTNNNNTFASGNHTHSGVYQPVGNYLTSNDISGKADITQSITDNDTTHSPSGNAIYDALALKSDTDHTHTPYDIKNNQLILEMVNCVSFEVNNPFTFTGELLVDWGDGSSLETYTPSDLSTDRLHHDYDHPFTGKIIFTGNITVLDQQCFYSYASSTLSNCYGVICISDNYYCPIYSQVIIPSTVTYIGREIFGYYDVDESRSDDASISSMIFMGDELPEINANAYFENFAEYIGISNNATYSNESVFATKDSDNKLFRITNNIHNDFVHTDNQAISSQAVSDKLSNYITSIQLIPKSTNSNGIIRIYYGDEP